MKHLSGLFLVLILFIFAGSILQSVPPDDPPATPSSGQEGVAGKKPDQPETYDINYAYDPGGRRDPFVSLLGGLKSKEPTAPKGALTVSDAKIVAINKNKEGYIAIITGSDKKARFMKAGDKLYDGEIISIDAERVVFRQDLTEDNPTAPGLKSKEVIKRLHPVQET
jgi:hypothetical protein